MFSPDLLKDQCGIVTGGTSGIGLSIARYLLKHGASVTVTGREEGKMREAAASLGAGAHGVVGDVRNPDSVAVNFSDHMARWGRVDFLVNNAAGNFLCRLEDMSPNAFNSVKEIVLTGTFLWSKAVMGAMRDQGSGAIVNTGTTYASTHAAGVAHSGAAKAGVLSLTRTMAVEWGPYGIRTNMVCPGPVEGTEGVRRLMASEEAKNMLLKMAPMPRLTQGWEVGAAVAFLLSPLAAFINGVALPIDGGLSLVNPGLIPWHFIQTALVEERPK